MSTQESEHTSEDFYIGYQPSASGKFRRTSIAFAVVVTLIALVAGLVIVRGQKKVSPGKFELGTLTTLKGILLSEPVPAVRILNGRDLLGNPVFQTIPLINFGKFGAAGLLMEFEKKIGKPVNEVEAEIEGTLIYRDGKTLFELTRRAESLKGFSDDISHYSEIVRNPEVQKMDEVELVGEIVDPKCYFGVMKPGEGKPHRSCAALCIKGGIPPVFVATDENQKATYFLLLGPNGEMINDRILDQIAIRVSVRGQAAAFDDWYIMYADPEAGIRPL